MKIATLFLLFALTSVVLTQKIGYSCNVQNCQECSYLNFCGLCLPNYILSIDIITNKPFCQQVQCNVSNCEYCLSKDRCQKCNPDYFLNQSLSCQFGQKNMSAYPENCAFFALGHCNFCQYGYVLNVANDECVPKIPLVPGCKVGFAVQMCQLCQKNMIVSVGYQCTPSSGFNCSFLQGCLECSSEIECSLCNIGFQLLPNKTCSVHSCNVTFCQKCSSSNCVKCIDNYDLIDNKCVRRIYGCNIANCISCALNPEVCTECESGYEQATSYYPKSNPNDTLVIAQSICLEIMKPMGQTGFLVKNCEKYGKLPFGLNTDPTLNIGCISCSSNYINVGGYCVANLTLSHVSCGISNCAYCIEDSYCGKCNEGYYVQSFTAGDFCSPYYSPLPGCELTIFGPVCIICQEGFVLNSETGQCISYQRNSFCNISGCDYCIISNQCFKCRNGFEMINTTNLQEKCSPICSVENCFECQDQNNCYQCSYGYSLSSGKCINSYTASTDCIKFGQNCMECNLVSCTACSIGTYLVDGTCCSSDRNYYGCTQYSNSCSPTCLKCQKGFFLIEGQCFQFPCKISNCSYCFRTQVCVVCNEGFTLNDQGVCTPYTISDQCSQNCITCDNNGCSKCLNGYIPYHGECVCDFQNCLACQGNAFCTKCAAPTFAPISSNRGCTIEPVGYSLCNVDNCEICTGGSYYCSVCANGYSLSKNRTICEKNRCERNCQLCDELQNICFLCTDGHIQDQLFGAHCVSLERDYSCEVEGCSLCSTPDTCQECFVFHQLTSDKKCQKFSCIDNCLFCFENATCFVCSIDFYLTTNNVCSPLEGACSSNISHCLKCVQNNLCEICSPGLMPSQDRLHCIPQSCYAVNCQVCLPIFESTNFQAICMVCQQGYYQNSYLQCVQYNPTLSTSMCPVYNCLYCDENNQCGLCLNGWNVMENGVCVTSQYCDVPNCVQCSKIDLCQVCETGYDQYGYSCQMQCNVNFCKNCSSPNFCSSCQDPPFLLENGKCVCPVNQTEYFGQCILCEINNCAQCSSENFCDQCITQFTLFNQTCVPCNIQYCGLCQKENVCNECQQNFVLADNLCFCKPTFQIIDGKCQCPPKNLQILGVCIPCPVPFCSVCTFANFCSVCKDTFILEDNQCICKFEKIIDDTCIICNIENCASCGKINQCEECQQNYLLFNNTCTCPETFEVVNGTCQCPVGKTEFNGSCLACQINNCETCQIENVCSTCKNTFVLENNKCFCTSSFTLYEDRCVLCDERQYCQTCSRTNFCQQCQPTFTVQIGRCFCPQNTNLFNNTCIQCDIADCTLCEEDDICETCLTEFTLINNVCILCLIPNCLSCSSRNYCTQCAEGLVVNSGADACITCNKRNCTVCELSEVCAVCDEGFEFNRLRTQCVLCSQVSGCRVCSEDNICEDCFEGFNLVNGTCEVCSYPCLECESENICKTCQSPFSTFADPNGQCYTCSVQNCLTCSNANPSACQTCAEQYELNSNKQCSLICSTNLCLRCHQDKSCRSCIDGYTPSGQNCLKCTHAPSCTNCQSNDPSICTSCNEGYYLRDGKCLQCEKSNCASCVLGADRCTRFKQSTNQIAFIDIDGGITPAKCNPGCSDCSTTNPSNCLKCLNGYSLQSGNCIPCASSCKTCEIGDESKCLSCFNNAFLNANSCEKCVSSSNCLTCEKANLAKCTACPYGYSLSGKKICVKGCPKNCLSCTNSTFCTVCSEGYSANNKGICLPCLSNCRECSGEQQAICIACGTGFFLNQKNKCQACSQSFCTSCTQSGCNQCQAGYTLTPSFGCAKNCQIPCASCSTTDPTKCNSCLAGYTFNEITFSCSPVTACRNNICDVCPFKFTLKGNECITCKEGCARCSTEDSKICTSCFDGTYLQNSACEDCPDGCETCSSAVNCLTCSSGYTAEQSPVEVNVNCVKCQSPCDQCTGNSQTCLSCVDGYQLEGWKCVSKFNFGLQLVLNTDLATFYNNYNSFLEGITSILSENDTNIVTMIGLQQGSVNVVSNITTTESSGSNSATNEYNDLSSALSGGNTIGGMPITSSTIQVNGGEVQSPDSGPNLGLILGITIPLAIIFIGLLVCLILRSKSRSPPSSYDQKESMMENTIELNDSTRPVGAKPEIQGENILNGLDKEENIRQSIEQPGEMEMQEVI